MPYTFEWDPVKSARCLRERKFDFFFAAQVFLDERRITAVDDRRDYGEPRYQTVGAIEGRAFFVAYTVRGDVIRIISARRANEHEEDAYRSGAPWR
jgi:hypothetical protein